MLDVSVMGTIGKNLPVTEELIRLTAIKTKLGFKIAILSNRITYFEKYVGNSGVSNRLRNKQCQVWMLFHYFLGYKYSMIDEKLVQ